jgi:hypothetical protein
VSNDLTLILLIVTMIDQLLEKHKVFLVFCLVAVIAILYILKLKH